MRSVILTRIFLMDRPGGSAAKEKLWLELLD
jgi:hypothetical protein